jgi:hypothetical protein
MTLQEKDVSEKVTAIYLRVSSKQQDHKSQMPDLERWAECHVGSVIWFTDKASGKTMDRPGWNKLADAIQSGKVTTVVVWRLDRLGRTAKGLTALFEELRERKVNLVSLKDSLDLSTAAGRVSPTKHASAHDLRRSFGFRWAVRVMPIVLQKLMRHASIDTTLKYYVGNDAREMGKAVWQAFRATARPEPAEAVRGRK